MKRTFQIHVCDPTTGAECMIGVDAASLTEAQTVAQSQGWLIGSGAPGSAFVGTPTIVSEQPAQLASVPTAPNAFPVAVAQPMNANDAALRAIARSPLIQMPVETITQAILHAIVMVTLIPLLFVLGIGLFLLPFISLASVLDGQSRIWVMLPSLAFGIGGVAVLVVLFRYCARFTRRVDDACKKLRAFSKINLPDLDSHS